MTITLPQFITYLDTCRRKAETARLFVLGHPAPDGDAAVSSLLEGWRRTLAGTPTVPVLQADSLPREVAWLLGEAAASVLTAPEATAALAHPDSRFILTDHHDSPYLSRTVAIVDHHPLTPGLSLAGIDVRLSHVGAATTLVAEQMQADGLLPDAGVARILLGGILLDTDGLSPHKAKAQDVATARRLAALCGEDTEAFYAALQGELLSETDVAALYRRDYRRYTRPDGTLSLGFAILKAWRDALPDREAVRRLLAADVAAEGYDACIAKLMLFTPDGEREEQYLVAGPKAGWVLDTVLAETGGGARRLAEDELYLSSACPQPGRKKLALRLLEHTKNR
ncbi:MAG: DHH family phosphoesterase [Clostridia bacterium]|nr:DHH family phosphoesterase [Clostridia bacterium]